MSATPIDFKFTDAIGRDRVLHAVILDGGEWHLHAALESRTFIHRCTEWQRVERTIRWLRLHSHEPAPVATMVRSAPVRMLVASLLMAVALVAAPITASGQPADVTGVAQYLEAVDDYTQLHRRLERQLPPLTVNADPATIRLAVDAMAAAIRAERRDAQPGNLFNPAVRATIRARIAEALCAHGFTAADVMAAERDEGIDPDAADLRVNGAFPWALGTAMFRCVLTALPPLPPELQYRIVGRDLVLIDLHANLIADILPFALGVVDAPCVK